MTNYIKIPPKQSKHKKCCMPNCDKQKARLSRYCRSCDIKINSGKVDEENLSGLDLQKLQRVAKGMFCEFIRLRDKGQEDISTAQPFLKSDVIQAGHIFNCDKFPGLIFDENNCHAQSERFNRQMDDIAVEMATKVNAAHRIGPEEWHDLVAKSNMPAIRNYKYSKEELISIYHKYKAKVEGMKGNVK